MISPTPTGIKNNIMLSSRNIDTFFTCPGRTHFSDSAQKSRIIPITLPGTKIPDQGRDEASQQIKQQNQKYTVHFQELV